MVRNVEKGIPLLFVDADVTLEQRCVGILYDEIKSNDKLIVVGAWPVPKKTEKMSLWENLMYNVLHARALHPEAEVAVTDVTYFKSYVHSRPQPVVSPEFELRSKIYFHGRTFMMRGAEFFDMPEDPDICDDTFLPNMIHTKHGPATIRTRYDANVYYMPYLSLLEHFRIYRRIFSDLKRLETHKEFSQSRMFEKTKLDWRFIISQGPQVVLCFVAYSMIHHGEKLCYILMPTRTLSELWRYDSK